MFYSVSIPVRYEVTVLVESESEEGAKELVKEAIESETTCRLDYACNYKFQELHTFELADQGAIRAWPVDRIPNDNDFCLNFEPDEDDSE